MDATGNVRGGPSVASRIFAVLDAFDGPASSLRLTEIAERTGIPLPTTLRMVRELVAWGGLERQGDGSYRIGRRMWSVGTGAPCVRLLRQAAAQPLHRLSVVTGRDVHLAVLDGPRALVLDAMGRGVVMSGDRLPLHASGVGKVLLAYAPDSVSNTVLRAGLPRLTRHTITARPRLEARLREIRVDAVASDHEESRLGRVSIAVPVPDRDGAVIAAIGLIVTSADNPARYLPQLRQAAAGAVRFLSAATTFAE